MAPTVDGMTPTRLFFSFGFLLAAAVWAYAMYINGQERAAARRERETVTTTAAVRVEPKAELPAPPPPAITPVVDIPAIANKTRPEVAALLGEPSACERSKYGRKCRYSPGDTEIVFINDRADWITVNDMRDTAYASDDALPLLGLEKARPTFNNENVRRWSGIHGLLEVMVWPGESGRIFYAYIKVATK